MRRANRLIGTVIAVGLLAACSAGKGVDTGGKGGSGVVAAIGGEPDQLDPHKTSSYFSFQVLENVFDTLVEPDQDLKMKPALAESWKTSADQKTWTFTLRKGVTWQDGSKFAASDVVYSYKRIIDKELSSAYRFAGVEDITAPDDSTVVIKLDKPMPNLLTNIGGYKGLAIVNKRNVESGEIAKRPLGTGPFSVASYKSGDSIRLTANNGWWGGKPQIPAVTFRFVPEPTTAMEDLKAGEVDWTSNVPPQQVEQLSRNKDVALKSLVSNDYWYLSPNEARKPFDDARVRQALAYAIDREAIAQTTMYGNATVNQLAIPKTNPWYTEYTGYSHDTARATRLLAEAGVRDLKIDMLVTKQYPETITAGQLIAAQLAKIGVTVKPRQVDWATWLDEQGKGKYDLLMLGWLGNLDPDDFYYAQHRTGGKFNFQKYSNKKVDSLLDAGRVETDEAKRKQNYADAARMIADDASYIYLYNPNVIQAWSPRLKGYTARSDGAIRFRGAKLGG
ncbi:ABC transporter substrate-binding protein [Actinomadura sp. WMMA1423]|uniref:ABC transporter substrate-binding protein n=1 Tax=Actinomadura sp. WMMA1423 TaxID=2591108 RepID=UPI0011469F1D|nr:ABC transporter substrate-binding protein [Actinomadura sp. WMMA1423]